ncbi:hypothetical protein NDU88_000060 [Pleurodeles waltl]|uniref:Uncharacterized protein n=1 Tax=Pleurodeles waltl TaxID=8319 RepID=A0AAV7MH19_PLEWA|nr:hypothetical protein NDU88_000060 [Pleurodeles waltl]
MASRAHHEKLRKDPAHPVQTPRGCVRLDLGWTELRLQLLPRTLKHTRSRWLKPQGHLQPLAPFCYCRLSRGTLGFVVPLFFLRRVLLRGAAFVEAPLLRITLVRWDLPDITQVHWCLPDVTQVHWDLPDVTQVRWDLAHITQVGWDLSDVMRVCWDLPHITKVRWDLADITQVRWDLS